MLAHKTAITRTKISAPAKWLLEAGLLQGRVLDYGCGKGKDAEVVGCAGYDPYYRPEKPIGTFDTIMCNFVLNVIESKDERREVLRDIICRLEDGGCAYITVRTDKKSLKGTTKTGTWQGLIVLGLPVVHRGSGYIIYKLTEGDWNVEESND